jgi:hypothetical protein
VARLATITIDGRRWRLAPGADPDHAETLIRRAMGAIERGEARNVKSGLRKRLYPLTLCGGDRTDHLLKVKEYQFFPGILRMVRRGSARREFDLAFALARSGFPVAPPMAVGEERRTGRLIACYLLCPILEDVVDLRRLLADPDLRPTRRRAIVAAFGAFSRSVHDAGLYQDDYAPNNFLVRQGDPPSFILIDFERAHLARPIRRSRRLWMLAKLDRHGLGLRASERMRFLKAYCEGNSEAAKRLWLALDRMAPRLASRDFRRMKLISAAEGRRFRHVQEDGCLVWAPRDVDIPWDLLRAQDGGTTGSCLPAAGERWILDYGPVSESAARRVWAIANTLWAWGALVPRPIFLARRAGAVMLGLARESSARVLSGSTDPGATANALIVLLDELGSVGEIDPAIRPDDIAVVPSAEGTLRAVLLAPHRFRFRRRPARDHHARARAMTRALLSGIARPVSGGTRPDPGTPAPAAADR